MLKLVQGRALPLNQNPLLSIFAGSEENLPHVQTLWATFDCTVSALCFIWLFTNTLHMQPGFTTITWFKESFSQIHTR